MTSKCHEYRRQTDIIKNTASRANYTTPQSLVRDGLSLHVNTSFIFCSKLSAKKRAINAHRERPMQISTEMEIKIGYETPTEYGE